MAPSQPAKMSYPCSECSFEAASARQLSRHKAVTHVENPLKCVLCPFVTAYQTNLLRHRREVHGICGSKGNKSCKFCGFLADDNDTLIQHQFDSHQDILKTAQAKFAKEKVSAGGDRTDEFETSEGILINHFASIGNTSTPKDRKTEELTGRQPDKKGNETVENDDEDRDFWRQGFMDDEPKLFLNFDSLQGANEQNELSVYQNTANWYTSGDIASSSASRESSVNEAVPKSKSMSKAKKKAFEVTVSTSPAQYGDLPATRIRRQYTCNDCGFRTVNPREFLYHRRDSHGQRLKIVECPYCVYACQYVQKLQRHLLLVHKLETSMTPPPEMALSTASSATSPSTSSSTKPSGVSNQGEKNTSVRQVQPTLKVVKPKPAEQPPIPKLKIKLSSPSVTVNSSKNATQAGSRMRLATVSRVAALKSPAKRPLSFTSIQRPMPMALHARKQMLDRGKKKQFTCMKCGYATNVQYLFKKHMKYHSAPKIKCELCDFESPYSWNVDRHIKSHYVNGLFKCTKCSFACDKKQALTVHVTQHHRDRSSGSQSTTVANDQQVEVHCGGGTRVKNEYGNSDEDNETHVEEFSGGVQVNVSSSGKQQIEIPYSKATTTFVRQGDGKIVAKPGVLKKCKYCNFQTDTFAKLQKHETSFHPEKRFQCPLCEIRFENLVWLQRHLTHMHQEDEQANVIINILDLLNPKRKRPKSATNIPVSHALPQQIGGSSSTFSQGKESAIKKKLVADKSETQCKICGYQTRWISELEKHMRVHTNERPFACPYCSFKSKWKGDLTRHIQKYHSRLPMPDLNSMEPSSAQDGQDLNMIDNGDEEQIILQPDINLDLDEENDDEGDIEEILMDEQPLPDDYEERPLEFDDIDDSEDDDNGNLNEQYREDLISNEDRPSPLTVKSGKVKMYRCSYCDFTCSTASRFHVHFVQHLNTKPFQCSVCGHRSNWEWDVTKHIKMKSQRDENHLNAKPVLVHDSGKRDYAKYDKYVVWMAEHEAEASNASAKMLDFRAKRIRTGEGSDGYDEGDINNALEVDFADDASGSYNADADPENIVITPDISFAVPGDDGDNDDDQSYVNINQPLQPNIPYNSADNHHEENSKLLQCSYCDFKHKESKVMVSHLSVHAGVQPYRCKKCQFNSNWREVVVRHCAAKHGTSAEDVEQRFKCTVSKFMCRIIDEQGNLKLPPITPELPSAVRHFQETHQSVRISGFQGNFTCNLCPFRATKAFHMDFHMKRHQPSSGPHKCPKCPYWVREINTGFLC